MLQRQFTFYFNTSEYLNIRKQYLNVVFIEIYTICIFMNLVNIFQILSDFDRDVYQTRCKWIYIKSNIIFMNIFKYLWYISVVELGIILT